MKNVQISLPDDLARDAAEAGLLDPAQLEALLRASLKQMKDALSILFFGGRIMRDPNARATRRRHRRVRVTVRPNDTSRPISAG